MIGALKFAGVAWIIIGVVLAIVVVFTVNGSRGSNFGTFLALMIGPLGAVFSGFLALGVARCIELLEEVRYSQREIQRKLNG